MIRRYMEQWTNCLSHPRTLVYDKVSRVTHFIPLLDSRRVCVLPRMEELIAIYHKQVLETIVKSSSLMATIPKRLSHHYV